MPARPTFFYDLNSPYAYLAALRVDDLLPVRPDWQPIAFGPLLVQLGRTPWSLRDDERGPGIAEVERRAAARGLPPISWPEGWPAANYSIVAPRAALYADDQDARRALTHELFRLTFVDGVGLTEEVVVGAARAAGLDGTRLQEALGTDELKAGLRSATDAAVELGVTGIPTVAVGDQLFWGDDRLEDAALALA